MSASKKAVFAVGGLVLVLGVGAVLLRLYETRGRYTTARNPCMNILRQLDGATLQWALENHKTAKDVPTWEEIRPYLRDGVVPKCPEGGTYTLGTMDKPPRCSHPYHALPE